MTTEEPTPLRNEKELCYECLNRNDCIDFIQGRRMACSDFGFVKKQTAPAVERGFTVEQIAFYCRKMLLNVDEGDNNILAQLNDPQDGIAAVTDRKESA